jgi:hypothetical protein
VDYFLVFSNRRLGLGLIALFIAPLFHSSSTSRQSSNPARPAAYFIDEAAKSGLTMKNVFGGVDTKKFIIETTGSGVAIFDYDNDGWPDIFLVNGTTLDNAPSASGTPPTNHLYRNNHDGTFTDVTEKAGLLHSGWGQGVCVGDYDNDGYEDLYVTYYGKNVCITTMAMGHSRTSVPKPGWRATEKNGVPVALSLTTTGMASSI